MQGRMVRLLAVLLLPYLIFSLQWSPRTSWLLPKPTGASETRGPARTSSHSLEGNAHFAMDHTFGMSLRVHAYASVSALLER